ncbi:MAG: patatin-like phospholipase family protein [Duncaniella sp.]|nr:patatin-like phospholipase family protein [Duncaniella sp.]
MRIFGIYVILTAMVCSFGVSSKAESIAERQTVGLVLSGGGAKGIAHIGVIKAFEDNGIPIDYITGTSMGAIVGGLYASGYSPEEMMELIESKGFAYWSTGKIDPAYVYYFQTDNTKPSFINLNLGKDSTSITSVLPMSLIDPIPMNYAFFELFSPYTAQCDEDFNRLFVPFRCVTSDVYAKHKVVLKSGPLGDAIRMSMSFPMVFEPIKLNGVPMFDGGIYDNYPVDVMMEEFNPDRVIGVNVGSKDAPPSSRNMMAQLEEMIMQPNDYPFPTDKGVNIRIDLDEFSLLDFDKCCEIYAIGYKRAMEMLDSVKMKVQARVPVSEVSQRRSAFKSMTPQVRVAEVKVSGGSPDENSYLRSFFRHRKHEKYLTIDETRDAYYRAVSSKQVQNFVPTPVYNAVDSSYTLDFDAVIKDKFNIGVGGYISSSTNSMLFFNTGYNTLNYNSIKASASAWLGQSYLAAMGDFRLMFNTYRPSELNVTVVTSRQKYHETDKLFYQINEPDFIIRSESFLDCYYSTALDLRSVFNVGLGYGHLTDRYYANIREHDITEGRDKGIFDLGKLSADWERNSYDNRYSPTSGYELYARAAGVIGRYHYRPGQTGEVEYDKSLSWVQADLLATNYWNFGKYFSLGGMARAFLSTRKLLRTYDASIVAATAFHPTPSSYNHFNPALRANSFAAAGVMPVWKVTGTLQVRGTFNGFLPLRKICYDPSTRGASYGSWLSNPEFFGEIQVLMAFSFGTVSAYGNYTTSPSGNWNFGISIGAFILAPKFLR